MAVHQSEGVDAHLQVRKCLFESLAAWQPCIEIEQAGDDLQSCSSRDDESRAASIVSGPGISEVGLAMVDPDRHRLQIVALAAATPAGRRADPSRSTDFEAHGVGCLGQLIGPAGHQKPGAHECRQHAGHGHHGTECQSVSAGRAAMDP